MPIDLRAIALVLSTVLFVTGCSNSGQTEAPGATGGGTATVSAAQIDDSESLPEPPQPGVDQGTGTPQPVANLQPIDIVVSWDAPALRDDGSALPLEEIGGYEVLWARKRNWHDPNLITIDHPLGTSIMRERLSPGNYTLKIFTFDIYDNLSAESSEFTLDIQSFPSG